MATKKTIIDEIIDKNPNLQPLKDAVTDLTQLTITTIGADGKKIETIIKLTGDVETTTELKGAQLTEFHEKMADFSVNIMKTYAQIFIQLVSVFIPWAGIDIPKDVFTNLNDLVKTGFKLPSTSSE
jgi:hypothetical protein